MGWIRKRFGEGSTWAGAGLSLEPIARLVLSGGKDPMAWGQVIAAAIAIAVPEKK